MKVSEAIIKADAMRPNKAQNEDKARWLLRLEAEIAEMMGESAPVYDVGTMQRDLLLPFPHDDCYPLYLAAQIDARANHDADLYTADKQMADDAISSAKAWYRRNNRPENSGQWKGL